MRLYEQHRYGGGRQINSMAPTWVMYVLYSGIGSAALEGRFFQRPAMAFSLVRRQGETENSCSV